jgi:hypothetical protein
MCCKICVSSSSSPCVYLWKPHHLVPEPRLSRLDLHRCWSASRGEENDILIADFTKEVLKEAFMQRCYQWVNLDVGRVWPQSDGITTSGTQWFIYVQTPRYIIRNNPTRHGGCIFPSEVLNIKRADYLVVSAERMIGTFPLGRGWVLIGKGGGMSLFSGRQVAMRWGIVDPMTTDVDSCGRRYPTKALGPLS